jgi:hypothetical protein
MDTNFGHCFWECWCTRSVIGKAYSLDSLNLKLEDARGVSASQMPEI